MWYFAIFARLALAAGFIPSGLVKILGEHFTALLPIHPMGHFLDAFYRTGYYYTFVGIFQVTAAILLLIPRTATLGAVIYFPIILNICILSLAVRFDGSLITSPLMVLADLYLLLWDYHKWKFILPFKVSVVSQQFPSRKELNNKFPVKFFTAAVPIVVTLVIIVTQAYEIMPRNTPGDCEHQCPGSARPRACHAFCNCIHVDGKSLNECLEVYYSIKE